MTSSALKTARSSHAFQGAAARILELQRNDGAIPWMEDGALDPWNHTEAAMGLSVTGYFEQAEKAYAFLQDTQLQNGAWWGDYGNAVPMEDYTHLARTPPPQARDSNFTAYIATGVWHHFLVTHDKRFLTQAWPMVHRAMAFVVSMQRQDGDISWCLDMQGQPADDALIAGCCSIYKSLGCAIAIAETLGDSEQTRVTWRQAQQKLGHALLHMPHRFDRQGQTGKRFSMDWYYPVLTGLMRGRAGWTHIKERWDEFVVEGKGCRCVNDQPWVTVAESCELVIALLNVGERTRAQELFDWQKQWCDEKGDFWMGYQFEEGILWPEEKPAWTSAAIILAADAFVEDSPTQRLFASTAD